jgi:hypothetical protein
MPEALAAVTVPSLEKAGRRVGIFSGIACARQLVGVDRHIALLAFHRHRRDLALEAAFLGGVLRAAQRFERVGVLLLARELVFLRNHVGEVAHRAAAVGVFRPSVAM